MSCLERARPPPTRTRTHLCATLLFQSPPSSTRTRTHLRAAPLFQDKEKAQAEQRRYSLLDPASAPELLRLQQQLASTEDALRAALEQAQQVDRLVEAMRGSPDRCQVSAGGCPGLRGRRPCPPWDPGLRGDTPPCPLLWASQPRGCVALS